eukprot:gene7999-7395_t
MGGSTTGVVAAPAPGKAPHWAAVVTRWGLSGGGPVQALRRRPEHAAVAGLATR